MKKLLLWALCIGGSAYSMDQEPTEIQLKKIEIALQILNTPEDTLRYMCAECGTIELTVCSICKRKVVPGSADSDLKNRAGHTLMRLKHLLPKADNK